MDYFLKKLIENKTENEIMLDKKPLYFFTHHKNNNTLLIKNLRFNSSSKIGVLLLFQLFNYIFKRSQDPLEEQLSDKNINILSDEILKDMEEDDFLEEPYSNFDNDKELEESLLSDKNKIDEYLSVFYFT